MSTYLYTSNVNENDKICFSYVPSAGTVRYKVNNVNGEISVDPAVQITNDNISDETNMVNKTSIYHDPEVNDSRRLLILLNKLKNPSYTLEKNYKNILGWLILYVENNIDTQIPETFNKERVKGIVNDAIQQINSMDDNLFNNYKDNNAAIEILVNILHPNSSSGGFNITRRLFGKRSNKRSDRDKRNRRTFRTSGSKRFGKKRRSTRRR